MLRTLALVFSALVACGGAPLDKATATPATASTSPSVTPGAGSIEPSPSTSSSTTASEPPPTALDGRPMLGPFKNLAEACKSLVSGDETSKSKSKTKAFDCLPGANLTQPPKASPIDRAMLVVVTDKAVPDVSVTHLALHLVGGWFVDAEGPEAFTDAAMSKTYRTDIVPGSGPAVFLAGALPNTTYGIRYDLLELTHVVATDPVTGKKGAAQFHGVRDTMLLCALGPSGAPSCLDPIRTELQLGKNGVAPEEPAAMAFSIVDGRWTVASSQHVQMLRGAGHLETHQEMPLSGAYVLHFP